MLENLNPSKTLQVLSGNGQPEEARSTPEFVTQRVELLMGCYRRGQAENPTVYVSAIAAVLSRYSPAVIRIVTDPVKGLPSKCDFLPTVKEVFDACEAETAPERREAERRARIAESHRLTAPGQHSATEDERARAVEQWERQRAEMQGKDGKDPEQERREAGKLLDAYRMNPPQIFIGSELEKKLAGMRGEG
jgi:hypothetical protein